MMQWNYSAMRAWYIKHSKYMDEAERRSPLFSIIYESKKAKKNNKKKIYQVEPFVKNDIQYASLSPVQNNALFQTPLYILADNETSDKQWLYLVFPTHKTCINGSKALFADHFTFCIDASDQKKPCHFHSTFYACDNPAGDSMYTSICNNDYMPDKLLLPRDEPSIFKKHAYAKDTLLEFIKHPWNQQQIGGGASGKRKKAVHTYRPITDAPFHGTFCDKWTSMRVKGLRAFGVMVAGGGGRAIIHWSVLVLKGRQRIGHKYVALHYTTPVFQDPFEYEIALWREFVGKYNV
jgi:hypothetical protein